MKKIVLKRTADALEKLAVGSMLVGLFQGKTIAIWIGFVCMAASYLVSFWEVKP